jgi:ActR/RegA family two-component response regulator
MTSEMAFECLFISSDAELFRTISAVLSQLSISVQICLSTAKAFDVLRTSKSDLMVIDWKGEESGELLQRIWRDAKNKKPTLVAISSDNARIPGAHVVIRKPISQDSAMKSFKAAYRQMVIDHRKNVRHALMLPVTLKTEKGFEVAATVTDLGDGGLGLCCKHAMVVGHEMALQLRLPGTPREVTVHVRVVWTRDFGRVGCEFVRIPPVDLLILHDWLKSKSLVKQPRIAI